MFIGITLSACFAFQDCTKSTCSRYECSLRNISPRESAVVALEFVINKEIIDIMVCKSQVSLTY